MRRVARAARSSHAGQTKAAVVRNRFQHLPYRMAATDAQITGEEAASVAEQLGQGGEAALSQVAFVGYQGSTNHPKSPSYVFRDV